MNINFEEKSQIISDINNIEQILSLNIFEQNYNSIIIQSVFTKLLIDLRDLIGKAQNIQNNNNSLQTNSVNSLCNISPDIINNIINIRNAACHINSAENKVKPSTNIRLSFNVIYGKNPNAIKLDNLTIGSDLDNDICILYGSNKIYYKHDIIETFQKYKKFFNNIL